MARIPSEIAVQIARKAKKDVWSSKEILETVKAEVERREIGENANKKVVTSNISPKKNHTPPKTAGTLHLKTETRENTKITCVFCGKNHFSSECKTVADAEKRKEILMKNGRCYKCIGTGHSARNCERKRKCRNCAGNHHQAICDRRDLKNNENSENSNQNVVNMEENEDNIKTANQKNILLKNEAVVATAKAGSPQKGKVLLQTAKTYAFCNETDKRVKVRVLLDLGGQRTFISDKMKDKLGLKTLKSEVVNLNTFGDNKYHKRKCNLVRLNLETVDFGS